MDELFGYLMKFAVETTFTDHESKFYVDDDEDCEEEEELLFSKNNVYVHSSQEKDSIPGYFTIKSRTRKNGHTRLIVSWTPNSLLVRVRQNIESNSDARQANDLEVFSVDLSEMKTLKLFYDECDKTCGQFVIGNHENHYKVLHFHCGGLNKITKILEEWDWCESQKVPGGEKRRKRCFLVTRRVPVKEDCYEEEGRYDPMSYDVWKTLINKAGQIEDVTNFRRAVFFGGLSPEVRNEAWKFLLFYYAFNSTYEERVHLKSKKEYEYLEIQRKRLCMNIEEQDLFWKNVQCTVDKDVPRTDRSHPYFYGRDNPNIEIMRNILLNYAIYNPMVGYNQGMSDLLAPVLAVVQDEVDAFWCFASLMESTVFVTSPKDDVMDRQLVYLRELIKLLHPRFYAHLLIKDNGLDMLFCHRWLLLCFKREFFNAEVLLMWEACWSRYQTEYFHIFLCVAMIKEYGDEVIQQDMQSDDMLHFFTDLSMKMDGSKVLRRARQLLLKFRQLPFISCSLRGLLSGPGIWDSAPLPNIECNCHGLCSSSRRNSGTLTDTDVNIMKNKDTTGLFRQEIPKEESEAFIRQNSSSIIDTDASLIKQKDTDANLIKQKDTDANLIKQKDTDGPKNEETLEEKEALHSLTSKLSNPIIDTGVSLAINKDTTAAEEKAEKQEIHEKEKPVTSVIVINSTKDEANMVDPNNKEFSQGESEGNTIEKNGGKTFDAQTMLLKDHMCHSSNTSIFNPEGTTELASKAIDDY